MKLIKSMFLMSLSTFQKKLLMGEIVGKKTCFMLSPFTVVGKSGTKQILGDTSIRKKMNVKWFCLQ